MTYSIRYPDHQERYEYHGNTSVVRVRCYDDARTQRDWIHFDTVQEATEFFIDQCASAC